MPHQTRYGRTASGKSPWLRAIPLGVVLTGLVMAVALALNHGDPDAWRLGLALGASTLPIGCAAGWVLVVDRSTLVRAPRRPEESVESRWYAATAAQVFHDLLIVLGVASLVLSLAQDWHLEARHAFPVVLALAAVDFATRYTVTARRDA